jgi:hypothetical protein
MWARMLIPFCWPAGLIAFLVTTKRGQLAVPLCVPCNGRWTQGVAAIVVGVVLLVGAFLGFSFGGTDDRSLGVAAIAVALVVFLVLALAVARPRMLVVDRIDDTNIYLKGFDPNAAREIVP